MARRNGFVYAQGLTGKEPVTQTYEVNASANTVFLIGDPVILASTGKINPVTASSSGAIHGIVMGVFAKTGDNDPPRPLTFNQPTTGLYLATGQSGFAVVNVDPEAIYAAYLDATASSAIIGENIEASVGAYNARAGISGFNLRNASRGAAGGSFKVVGIHQGDALGRRGDIPTPVRLLVKPNSTQLTSTTSV
jgi:hypothetical protein